jgi:hypothetical protein
MDVRGYVETNAREFFDDLKQWLAIPSISGDLIHSLGIRAALAASGGAQACAYLWEELAAADLR